MQTMPEKATDASKNTTKEKSRTQTNKELKSEFASKISQNEKKKPKARVGNKPHIK